LPGYAQIIGNQDVEGVTMAASSVHHRARLVGTIVAGAFVAILTPIATILAWYRWRILDSDRMVKLLYPVGTNNEVRDDLTNIVTSQLTTRLEAFEQSPNVDLLRPLIGALGGIPAAVSAIGTQIRDMVYSDQFSAIWTEILTTGYLRLVSIIKGNQDGVLATSGGDVTLDVGHLASAIDQSIDGFADVLIGVLWGIAPVYVTLYHMRSLAYLEFAARHATTLAVGSFLLGILSLIVLLLVAENRSRTILWTAGATILTFIGTTIYIETEVEKQLNRVHDANANDIARVFSNTVIGSLYDVFVIVVIALAIIVLLAFIYPRWLEPWWRGRHTPVMQPADLATGSQSAGSSGTL
jgi:hypothetical protein